MSTIAVKLLFADVKLLQFALMLLDYPPAGKFTEKLVNNF